jgi:hypothetical protein
MRAERLASGFRYAFAEQGRTNHGVLRVRAVEAVPGAAETEV